MSGKIDNNLSSIIFYPVVKKPSDLYKIGERLHKGLSYLIIDINDLENEIVISDKLGNIYVYSGETGECLACNHTLPGLEDYRLPRIVENNCPLQTVGVNLKGISNLKTHYSSSIFISWLRDCLKKARKSYPKNISKIRIKNVGAVNYIDYIVENPNIRVYDWCIDLYGKPFFQVIQYLNGEKILVSKDLPHKTTDKNYCLHTLFSVGGYNKIFEIMQPTEEEIKAFLRNKKVKTPLGTP